MYVHKQCSPSNGADNEELDQRWSVKASSREYAPQKPDRLHIRASVALWMAISEACSPTLSVLVEGGTGMVVCNVSKIVWCRVSTYCVVQHQKQPHLLHIYTRAEGGQQTVMVAISDVR